MARSKKGSKEAKAYVASIRPDKSKKRGKRSMARRDREKRSHKAHRVVHVIPDAVTVGGLFLPMFQGVNGNYSPVQETMQTKSLADGVNYGITSYESYWKEPVVGVVGGLALKWIGKKLGLNRLGTKKFKLF